MRYISTRDNYISYSFQDVLMRGMAPDGGLFLPQDWPALTPDQWRALQGASYDDVAFEIMRRFTGGDISDKDLKNIIHHTYGGRVQTDADDAFRHPDIAPLKTLSDNLHVMELFHGPTLAFKDVALQFLGQIFNHQLKQSGDHVTIIGATSGDTGSAAIEGCKHCGNARIFILHPHKRTSDVQRRQMTTVLADNVHNIALEGTFDDCQNIVKQLFADTALNTRHKFTAVNSINWVRIMAQIIYYAHSALQCGAPDTPVQFVVPTGNFGNIFAAFCAHKLGLPIEKLIIATNTNDILTRFVETGRMERTDVQHTLSPSMDIQISSNFERYLFELFDRDEQRLNDFMDAFKNEGCAAATKDDMIKMHRLFGAYRIDDDQTRQVIEDTYKDYRYTLDPHSAVGMAAAKRALADGALRDDLPVITLACAHPAKFPEAVTAATGTHPALPDAMADLFEREERYTVLPNHFDDVAAHINNT